MPRRLLYRLLGVALFTWLEFAVFPGHTYLHGETQLSVPMLERLENPGFLSRDLVATHPNLEYTVYDETTLFLNAAAGIRLEQALGAQQIASRAAGILGLLLLALSAGLTESAALLVAAIVSLGGTLAGPNVLLTELESIPRSLAWGFILLAIGLIAREKPLLAGLAGGLALIYQPAIAAPFWVLIMLALVFDGRLRRLLRPTMTILAVFGLLLANLVQLQPGRVEQQAMFGIISEPYAILQRYRNPYEWVSLWNSGAWWSYFAIWICGSWAVARIWPVLNRQSRWLFVALPACGAGSIPVSFVLLDCFRWSFISQIQPTRWLLFTICLSAVACGIAAVRAANARRFLESTAWLSIVFALPMHAEILDLLRLNQLGNLERLAISVLLACAASFVLLRRRRNGFGTLALMGPLLAIAIFRLPVFGLAAVPESPAVLQLADWVSQNTWGSSMFLFPDLGRSSDPGVFRARSERALWVDWNSGRLVPYFESFAAAWWERWQQTMQPGYAPQRLQSDLQLPIDYYVLSVRNRLANLKPVFANEEFIVYDANDLRNLPGPPRSARPKN